MGRRLRTTIHLHPKKLLPKVINLKRVRDEDRAVREKQRRNFNRRHAARNIPPLLPGASVWVNDCKAAGVVIRSANRPRSYVIRMGSGAQIERNRRALVRLEHKAHDEDGSYDFPQGISSPNRATDFSHPPIQETAGSNVVDGRQAVPSPAEEPGDYVTRSGRRVIVPKRYGY
ncbi:hypothetical protein MTO96_035603 [Rhipicephalus appendiculatus]